jgi:polysaccharide biosynthesis transport protein
VWNQGVLAPVIEELDLPYGVADLRPHVFAWTISGTQIIEISVEDTDPEMAASIANAIGDSLMTYVEADTLQRVEPGQSALNAQLNSTSDQIGEVEAELVALEEQADSEDVAAQARINQLHNTLDRLNDEYADLRSSQQRMELSAATGMNPLKVATPAEPSTTPGDPGPQLALMFGSGFGALVAAAVVLTLGYLDKTVKPSTDYVSMVGAPLLGSVESQTVTRKQRDDLFVCKSPHTPASEAVRALRVSIAFRFLSENKKRLVISSPDHVKGKSVLVANLAIATAQAGFRTVLIDGNLRNASQHRVFGIRNDVGLSTWLTASGHPSKDICEWHRLASQSLYPNLWVIPSGPGEKTPSDVLLGTERLGALLSAVDHDADLVIIDAPAVLASSDAALIASEAEGVIIVCRPSDTEQPKLMQSSAALEPTGTPIVGVVLSEVVECGPAKRSKAASRQPHVSMPGNQVQSNGIRGSAPVASLSE